MSGKIARTYRRRKMSFKDDLDHISRLPNDVISKILSLLSTTSAVGTSVLSTRWRYHWTSVENLNFDFECSNMAHMDSKFECFSDFVDRVLNYYSSMQLKQFSLNLRILGEGNEPRVSRWIDNAIRLNVCDVSVHVSDINFRVSSPHYMVLPSSLFTTKTITSLTLILPHYFLLSFASDVSLPYLKTLNIVGHHGPGNLVERLLSGCPVLEYLSLGGYLEYKTGNVFTISTLSLKHLKMGICRLRSSNRICKIVINSPNLELLHVKERLFLNYIVENSSSLVEACVEVEDCSFRNVADPQYYGHVITFLKGISSVQKLSLAIHASNEIGYPSYHSFPIFYKMESLEVTIDDYRTFELLPLLMEHSPRLKILSINKIKGRGILEAFMGRYVWLKSSANRSMLDLEEIKVQGFKGFSYELKFLEFLLENATVLKKLEVNCQGWSMTEREEAFYCTKLMTLSRASMMCQIKFCGEIISEGSAHLRDVKPMEHEKTALNM